MELTVNEQAKRLEAATTLDELVERARGRAEGYADHTDVRLGRTLIEDDGSWRFNGDDSTLR